MNLLQSCILVVDDERIIADTLALIFQQHGFRAVAAYSGEEAVEAARTHRPDMVISDIVMGRMNGLEAAIRIKAELSNCRVVLFSGQPSTAELLLAAKADGHSFEVLAKPVHPEVLLEKVKAATSC